MPNGRLPTPTADPDDPVPRSTGVTEFAELESFTTKAVHDPAHAGGAHPAATARITRTSVPRDLH
jgi:hypothetical protein